MDNFVNVKNKRPKACIALSGGIDSTIAGWLLKQKGFELTGVYLNTIENKEQILLARQAAEFIDIPIQVIDIRKQFNNLIIQPFIKSYMCGLTPNPCIFCNSIIKCGILLDWAIKEGFPYLATGHYAQIEYDSNDKVYLLSRGIDLKKDQSYFLYRLSQNQLGHLIFPLGSWEKKGVINLATRLGFTYEGVKESQEICFIPLNDYHLFLNQIPSIGCPPGIIYDQEGNVLGTHTGLPYYTIGQRKGLHLKYPGPYYVLELNFEQNSIIVGKEKDLFKVKLSAHQIHKIISPWPKKLFAQIRSNQQATEAFWEEIGNDAIKIAFLRPVKAITPGQSVVLYDKTLCLGGGIIKK